MLSPVPSSQIQVLQTLPDQQHFLDSLRQHKHLSLTYLADTPGLIFFSRSQSEITAGYINISLKDSAQLIQQFLEEFTGDISTYDLKTVWKALQPFSITLKGQLLDVLLGGYVENSSLPHTLDQLAKRYLDEDITISSQNSESSDSLFMQEVPDSESLVKPVSELQIIYTIAEHLQNTLPPKLLNLWVGIESPLAPILGKMEYTGVYIDRQNLEKISHELETESTFLHQKVLEQLDSPDLNLNSTQQLGKVLIERGFEIGQSSNGKKVSTDKDTLEKLLPEDESGVIHNILEYRTVSKLLSTYTESFLQQLDSDSRLHGTYSQAQVATGRLSSANPNLQNIPIKNPKYGQRIRSTFASPEGRVLLSADYSQMELRILAHFTQDPRLLEAFHLNQDIHARTAAEIFDIPIDQVTSDQRRLGKTLNFALVYQQGAFATSQQLGISQKEAAAFIEKYFERFSHVKPFVQQVLESARENGYVESLYGRRRYFQNLKSSQALLRRNDERAAFNAVLQGTNADLIKMAMIEIEKNLQNQGLDALILLQIHDELVLESREDIANQVQHILVTGMELNQPLTVPIIVESGIGKNWAESK